MAYNLDNFVGLVSTSDRVLKIYDSNNLIKYTINAFSINTMRVRNNIVVLSTKLKNIELDFSTSNEARLALSKLQTQVDILKDKNPLFIDKEVSQFFYNQISSVTGPQGLQGLTGPQGFQGLTGPQGLQGLTGPQGLQGFTGTQGFQGLTGPQGFTGPQGLQGLTGPQGLQGLTGPQGLQGLTGPQGLQGFTGPQGEDTSILSINSRTNSYTIQLQDSGNLIYIGTTASTLQLGVPNNTVVPFPIGTQVLVARQSTGEISFSPSLGVTIRSAQNFLRLNAQYSVASLIKIDTNTWLLSGDLKL